MAHSPNAHDRGTRFTNYSSIHSADAFVGDYQVMYTPGSTSPQFNRGTRKASRFSRAASNQNHANISQSFIIPSNIPNTSQIMPDHGVLPNIQVHYNIPADEKQIVASLRSLQRDLAEAMETIKDISRERDEALHELRLLRATSRKPTSPVKKQQSVAERVEEELFDLSRSEESSPKEKSRQSSSKKDVVEQKQATVSDNARVLSPIAVNVVNNKSDRVASNKNVKDTQKQNRKAFVEDTEQSVMIEDPTAASNTSRRRRRPSLEENMTSAYILPDITVEEEPQQQQKKQQQPQRQVSQEAQNVLHSLEPEHIAHCEVCQRLTTVSTKHKRVSHSQRQPSQQQKSVAHHKQPAPPQQPKLSAAIPSNTVPKYQPVVAKIDYTAQIAGFPNWDESLIEDPTMRPKIAPPQALARVRALMNAQFLKAKERHHDAWLKYDGIDAPSSSRKHAQIGKEMSHWAEKMEECRVHLDYLRDVEEGMEIDNHE